MTELANHFWLYGVVPMVMSIGVWLSIKSGFFQVFAFLKGIPSLPLTLWQLAHHKKDPQNSELVDGVKSFWSALGCSIGIGNIITISLLVSRAGPGVLFWLWVGGFVGVAIRYSETYLSL